MPTTAAFELKAPTTGDPRFDVDQRSVNDLGRGRGRRCRCPLCGWIPDGHPHWGCDACHTMFDTFATRARCPGCPKSWVETQCISCFAMSPHDEWYVDEDDDDDDDDGGGGDAPGD